MATEQRQRQTKSENDREKLHILRPLGFIITAELYSRPLI